MTACGTIGMVCCFHLSLICKLITGSPTLRKAFSTGTGLFFGFYIYGFAYVLTILTFVAVVAVMKVFPRSFGVKVAHLLAFVLLVWINWVEFSCGLGLTKFSVLTTNIFNYMRLSMLISNYSDAGKLTDEAMKDG